MTTTAAVGGTFEGQGAVLFDTDAKRKGYRQREVAFVVLWALAVIFLIMTTVVALLTGVWTVHHADSTENAARAKQLGYGTISLATLQFVIIAVALAYFFYLAKRVDTTVRGRVTTTRTRGGRAVTTTTP